MPLMAHRVREASWNINQVMSLTDPMQWMVGKVKAWHPSDDLADPAEWICAEFRLATDSCPRVFACAFAGHWTPFFVDLAKNPGIHSTPEGRTLLLSCEWQDEDFWAHPITSEFPADCGFQALGWLRSLSVCGHALPTVSIHEASCWRMRRSCPQVPCHMLENHGADDCTGQIDSTWLRRSHSKCALTVG